MTKYEMEDLVWKIGAYVLWFVGPVLVLFILYVMFIFVPVVAYAEAECLRAGYPNSRVTIGLERYCLTLDGTVTVRVDKQ